MVDVCVTADLEQDCPPYLNTWRGMDDGVGALLDLLDAEGVRATFFTTGETARRYPRVMERLATGGHEIGCHGYSHRAFPDMDRDTAAWEINEAMAVLRRFGSITAFRAPYLRFPDAYLGLLEEAGVEVDSSLAKYKLSYYRSRARTNLRRVPASVTSSVLRLPPWIRQPYLAALATPAVLFVHPWEFVDLRREKLRLDCRFNTGRRAVECLQSVIHFFKGKQGNFRLISEVAG